MRRAALDGDARLARIRANIEAFHGPRLAAPSASWKRGAISICGYGPSLADTWDDLRRTVMTTSGAHDFLLERGVVPTYHVECDPRPHKAEFLRRPHPDVTYLINSQCHPETFRALAGYRVVMWHGFTDDDAERQIAAVTELEPRARLLAGGTTVGQRAIVVARELGYTDYDLHGLDCSYRGGKQWAGPHSGERHATVRVRVGERVFETSDLMLQATDDFINLLLLLHECRWKVHGDGLLESRVQLWLRDPKLACSPEWWEPVDFVRSKRLTINWQRDPLTWAAA